MKLNNEVIAKVMIAIAIIGCVLFLFSTAKAQDKGKLEVDIESEELEYVNQSMFFYYEGEKYEYSGNSLCAHACGDKICVLPEVKFENHCLVLETASRIFIIKYAQ